MCVVALDYVFVVDASLCLMSKASAILFNRVYHVAFEGMVSAACSDLSRIVQNRD